MYKTVLETCKEKGFYVTEGQMYSQPKNKNVPSLILSNEHYPLVCFDMSEPNAEDSVMNWLKR